MMTTKRLLVTTFLLAGLSFIYGQEKLEYFPGELNIQPFTANIIEPRIGCSDFLTQKNVRLDIGTSMDILHYKKSSNETFSFGADFFTSTRLQTEENFRFPVETIDYLFGVNGGYKKIEDNREYGLRARISHISAHLVDGEHDNDANIWKNGLSPMVYSREFVELFPYYRLCGLRVYAGLTYIFHSIPKNVGKGLYQVGFDYFADSFICKDVTPFAAYDFKVSKDDKAYLGNNSVMAGIKFGKYNSRGISVYASYISGRSIHGEYFYRQEHYSSIGFNLDL
mgnify:CR=1 FL=1